MIKFPKSDVFFNKQKNVLDWGVEEFLILQPKLKNYRTCLDIGAHCGLTTLRYAKHFKIVHSFEPLLYDFLVDNTKHLLNVTAHNCAISDTNSIVEIYPNPWNSGGGIIPDEYNSYFIDKRYEGTNAQMPEVEKILVECFTIDQFNYTDVDLIKIDVEGHILPVIKGMMNTLIDNSPVLQIEMSAFEEINEQVYDIVLELGYRKFSKYGKHDEFYCRD